VLSFSGSLRVLVALEPCDMRAGFNTLQGLVAEKFKENVKSGTLFVFSNRRHTRLKVLYWDGTGLWLLTKRLERGTFSWPRAAQAPQSKMQLTPEAFTLLTDGIDLHGAKPRAWYERGEPGA
jgi:transposase